MYPTFKCPIILLGAIGTSAPEVGSRRTSPEDTLASVVDISAQAAITDEPTMRKKEASVRPVTDPPNHSTSPYAIRIIVRFLNILNCQLWGMVETYV